MKSARLKPFLWLLLSLVSAGSMEFYTARTWSANQPPGFSDLYSSWWAAHEVVIHGRDPYSPALAHEIQTVIYGAPLASTPDDPAGIGGGFAYQPFTVLPFSPTVYMSFSAVQKIFFCVSVVAILLSLALWLYDSRLRPPPLAWITIAFFVMGSFPALQAIKLQNLSVIAAALIAITLYCLAGDRLVLAGTFLAASTFKPQFAFALILWVALWTLSDWRRRRSVVWSFLATVLLLGLISEWLVPGWLPSFLRVIRDYGHYTYGHSLLDVWFTPALGRVAAWSLMLVALKLCWPYRSQSAHSPRFFMVTSLILAANVVVIPTLAPHVQLLLIPGFLCLLRGSAAPCIGSPFARLFSVAAWSLLAWPWIASFALLLAGFRYPFPALLHYWQVPLYTSPILPLAVLLALGCLLRVGQETVVRDISERPSTGPRRP
jgi:hypothetical protein